MIRTVSLASTLIYCTTAWGQVPFDPGMPPQVGGPMYQQPMPYPQAMPQPYYGSPYSGGFSPYGGVAPMGLGYGGLGYGGYGLGGYGYGGFGYGMRGYYPPNPFG